MDEMDRLPIRGIFPALTTPFEGGEPALTLLRHNIRAYNAAPLAGYVVLGSTGEFPHLSYEEKLAVLATVREETAPGKLVIAGTGGVSTAETVRLTRAAAAAGAQAAMVVPPYYFRPAMTDEALERHYLAVAEASPIPVLLYNIPALAGVSLSPALVAVLAAHPNVAGIKDSSGDVALLQEYMREAPAGFNVLTGTAATLLAALSAGGAGAILALANLAPWECVRLYETVTGGEYGPAGELQRRLAAVDRAVCDRHGIPGVKYAMDVLGYFGLEPRPPLLPLGGSARSEIAQAMVAAGLILTT